MALYGWAWVLACVRVYVRTDIYMCVYKGRDIFAWDHKRRDFVGLAVRLVVCTPLFFLTPGCVGISQIVKKKKKKQN